MKSLEFSFEINWPLAASSMTTTILAQDIPVVFAPKISVSSHGGGRGTMPAKKIYTKCSVATSMLEAIHKWCQLADYLVPL